MGDTAASLHQFFMTPARVAGLLIFAALLVGVALRKYRRVHPKIMLSAFAADLALVVYLELDRGAVQVAVGRIMSPIMVTHVALATVSLLLYGVLIYSGIKILKGSEKRLFHRSAAITFLIVRLAVVITAYWVTAESVAAV